MMRDALEMVQEEFIALREVASAAKHLVRDLRTEQRGQVPLWSLKRNLADLEAALEAWRRTTHAKHTEKP